MARHRRPLLLLLLLLAITGSMANQSSKCLCQQSGCLCCVELNLTASIDLGGPACVNVRQNQRNVSLNLSYADNPVHNATIALEAAARKPTCMNLLSDLAQICAEFVSMSPAAAGQPEQGFDGCLVIEPALLGAPQATYPVGCFNLARGMVKQIQRPFPTPEELPKPAEQEQQQQQQEEEEEEEEEEQGLNAEELIAAVSASAEQGIALFSQWLGLNLGPRLNITALTSAAAAAGAEPSKTERPAAIVTPRPNSGRHARTFHLLTAESEDKSEERLKQLLSAQDNILKESAKIGEPSHGLGTAFLYSQPSAEEMRNSNNLALAHTLESRPTISPENLAVVPSESRRGGRAYNIHQHVNEV